MLKFYVQTLWSEYSNWNGATSVDKSNELTGQLAGVLPEVSLTSIDEIEQFVIAGVIDEIS